MSKAWRRVSVLPLLLVLSVGKPSAESAEGTPPDPSQIFPVTFNFAPPGARSLGMGGSFIAIADDATASEANPAGLTILTRPEVSLHGRRSSFNVPADDLVARDAVNFVDQLRDEARREFPQVPDFIPSSTEFSFDDSATSASYASYVKPFERWVFSLYYLETANFVGESSLAFDDDVFLDNWRSTIDLDTSLRSVGASAAFKIRDVASFGLSVRSSQLDMSSLRTLRVDYFNDIEFTTENFDHTDFTEIRQEFDGDDRDLTFNVGLLLNPNGKISLGLVYKEGGDYTIAMEQTGVSCVHAPAVGLSCDPAARTGNAFQQSEPTTDRKEFSLPDVAGLGVAWRPIERLTIAADVNRITYSNLNPSGAELAGTLEEIDDATDVHLGIEYTLLGPSQRPYLLRAGFYSDPDHDIYTQVDSDETHLTLGIGTVFLRNLQIDLAGDFADNVDTTLLSLVYRF